MWACLFLVGFWCAGANFAIWSLIAEIIAIWSPTPAEKLMVLYVDMLFFGFLIIFSSFFMVHILLSDSKSQFWEGNLGESCVYVTYVLLWLSLVGLQLVAALFYLVFEWSEHWILFRDWSYKSYRWGWKGIRYLTNQNLDR